MGMPESKVERGETAHRQAHDVRPVDRKVIEHGFNVVGGKGLRIGAGAFRHVRWRITPGVEHDAAIAPAEVAQLRFPTSEIACEFVHEDQRRARSGFFAVQPDPVLCDRVRHVCLSQGLWRVYTKIPAKKYSTNSITRAGGLGQPPSGPPFGKTSLEASSCPSDFPASLQRRCWRWWHSFPPRRSCLSRLTCLSRTA